MNSRSSRNLIFLLILMIVAFAAAPSIAADTHRLLNLRGHWKFKLGDNRAWAESKFNDESWSEIYVPSSWEEEGYPGYDGYAWYRRHFEASENWRAKDILLEIGMVDDVDEVYLNGRLVGGTGGFPPDFETAYDQERQYSIPFAALDPNGDNVIAVRVFDDHGPGGIVGGRVGIYERRYFVDPDVQLPIEWKFKTGDDMDWKDPNFNDSDWKEIRVPANWETQGYKGYDGYAWYRATFNVPSELKDETLVMLVGKIDDFDEVYINGIRIGKTGPMPKYKMTSTNSDEYSRMRAYTIPAGTVRFGEKNLVAVRVYDCWQGGGIYEGPLGIVTREHFRSRNYRHTARSIESWFENLFDDVFHP